MIASVAKRLPSRRALFVGAARTFFFASLLRQSLALEDPWTKAPNPLTYAMCVSILKRPPTTSEGLSY